jgi:hypothetical protein
MCYMAETTDHLRRLSRVAAQTDRQRARASAKLLKAVGEAADRGLTQIEIAASAEASRRSHG